MLKKFLFIIANLLLPIGCYLLPISAQTSIDEADLHKITDISPYYFGPNAFPIPDMLDGRVEQQLRVELNGDYFDGYRGDKTEDVAFKLSVPLFTKRVCLEVWGCMEWYQNSDENLRVCRLAGREKQYPKVRRGFAVSDFFVSTNIQVLTEKNWRPDITARIALKTASTSNSYYLGRFYDSPGYFFDATVAESFKLGHGSWDHHLRVGISGGFLCWQTDNGRQDDAWMGGVMVKWDNRYFSLSEVLGGYDGWENTISYNGDDAHDAPMSLKTRLDVHLAKHWELVAGYQRGIHDFPYQQFSLGAAYRLDIIK